MTNYDDVFHKKIASQDTGEVILFTKKSRTKINPSASMEFEPKEVKFEAEDELDEYSECSTQKDPALLIEFDSNNKIELVPKKEDDKFFTQKEIDPLLVPMFDKNALKAKDEAAIEWVYEKNEGKDSPGDIDPLNPTRSELDVQKQIFNEIRSRNLNEKFEENEVKILSFNTEINDPNSRAIIEIDCPQPNEDFIQSQILNEIKSRGQLKDDCEKECIVEIGEMSDEDDSDSDEGKFVE